MDARKREAARIMLHISRLDPRCICHMEHPPFSETSKAYHAGKDGELGIYVAWNQLCPIHGGPVFEKVENELYKGEVGTEIDAWYQMMIDLRNKNNMADMRSKITAPFLNLG